MVVTFLPFDDVQEIAQLLNKKHHNKQCTECVQLIKALEGQTKGYTQHAATRMWEGHVDALKTYYNIMLRAWYARGGKGTRAEYKVDEDRVEWPWWWGWDKLMLTHRLSLYRKDPEHYTAKKLGLTKTELTLRYTVGYIWPHKVAERYGTDLSTLNNYTVEALCDPLGQGVPAHYLWSLDLVKVWREDRMHNPKTGRLISATAKTGAYKQLTKAEAYYEKQGLL